MRDHRTVHAFSRPGRELIRLPGLAWLRDIRWPVASAVLDGEAVAGDGSEGIQAVFEARTRPGSPMAFAAFDVLELDGHRVTGEPWTARRSAWRMILRSPAVPVAASDRLVSCHAATVSTRGVISTPFMPVACSPAIGVVWSTTRRTSCATMAVHYGSSA